MFQEQNLKSTENPKHEILKLKLQEVKESKKAADLYNVISWTEDQINQDEKEELVSFKKEYENIQRAAIANFFDKIGKAPSGKNWNEQTKVKVNEHIKQLYDKVSGKIKALDSELRDIYDKADLSGQKVSKTDARVVELVSNLNQYQNLLKDWTTANEKVNPELKKSNRSEMN